MIDFDDIDSLLQHCKELEEAGGLANRITPSVVIELIAHLRQAEKDAARYRWLRDESTFTHDNAPLVLFTDCNGDAIIFNSGCVLHDEDLDKAIDEAMQCK